MSRPKWDILIPQWVNDGLTLQQAVMLMFLDHRTDWEKVDD